MTRKKIIFSDNTLWGLINFRGKVIKHYVSKGYKVIVIAPQNEVSELQTEIPDYVTYIPVNMDRKRSLIMYSITLSSQISMDLLQQGSII